MRSNLEKKVKSVRVTVYQMKKINLSYSSMISLVTISLLLVPTIGVTSWFVVQNNKRISIDDNAELRKHASRGDGSLNNPYIIENKKITTFKPWAIIVSGTSFHFIIQNCEIRAGWRGITISFVANGTAIIRNNIIIRCKIALYSADGTQIYDNIFKHSGSLLLVDSQNIVNYNNTLWKNN